MNFELLEGQRDIGVPRSERNALLPKGNTPNVFIKNLDKTVTNQELFLAFSQFGNVISSKVTRDRNGISKCYGFVQFEEDEPAMRSIFALNGSMVKNKILCVQRYVEQEMSGHHGSDSSKRKFTNVYVKNFEKDVTDDGLREMFQRFGKIVSPKIMLDSCGMSRGFGFVSFESPDVAHRAISEMNGKMLPNGKMLYVCRAQKKQERDIAIKAQHHEYGLELGDLWISNLDDSVDDGSLRNVFEPYGTITTAKVLMKQGRSIGIGRVCFSRPEHAVKAIAATNGRIIGSKPIVVYLTEDTTRSSFGEKRLSQARPQRPNWLEIANSTMDKNGASNGYNDTTIEEHSTEKRKPNMAVVFRMLSPPDSSETQTICFDRV